MSSDTKPTPAQAMATANTTPTPTAPTPQPNVVRLPRVQFLDKLNIGVPGQTPGVLPSNANILEAMPKMGRQPFLLSVQPLCPGGPPVLVIEHPASHVREHVPLAVVQQMTVWSEEAEAALRAVRQDQGHAPPEPARRPAQGQLRP